MGTTSKERKVSDTTIATEIELDVITNHNDLNTIIAELVKLREKYGGKSMVYTEVVYEPHDERGYVGIFCVVNHKE